MMRRRFVRHPRRYAGHRPIGLRNYDQLSATVGVLPDNEHDLAATGMERVVNPPLYRVLAGSMSLLRRASGKCSTKAGWLPRLAGPLSWSVPILHRRSLLLRENLGSVAEHVHR